MASISGMSSSSRERQPTIPPPTGEQTGLLSTDGQMSTSTVGVLTESEPLLGSQNEEFDAGHFDRELSKQLPWYKRPSPTWILMMFPFAAIAMAATIAPRVEIYTKLVCREYRPEYTMLPPHAVPSTNISTSPALIPLPPLSPSVSNLPSLFDYLNTPIHSYYSGEGSHKNLCASDPVVQAKVAELMAGMTIALGILSCLTCGFWSQLSDRIGRTRILGIATLGVLVTDFIFIFVSHYAEHLPFGYRFLALGPVFDGIVGGLTTVSATSHAYIADCTNTHSRSRVFSRYQGLFFTGLGVGPSIGSVLIRLTNSTLSVFYMAAFFHVVYAIFVWYILPESLGRHSMAESRKRHEAELGLRSHHGRWKRLGNALAFFRPMALLLPAQTTDYPGHRSWSLTALAGSYAFSMLIISSYQFKMQFAQANFGLDAADLGFLLSVVGAMRALYLIIILPLILKYFKSKPIKLPSTPSTSTQNSSNRFEAMIKEHEKQHRRKFDLWLARFSMMWDLIIYIALILRPTIMVYFAGLVLAAFAGGFNPAMQSLAVELYNARGGKESGRLFGALSVVQALSSQIIGPAFFGSVYAITATTFPTAIFLVCGVAVFSSFTLLLFVRLPQPSTVDEESRRA